MGKAQEIPPSKGVPERQRGRGMLVRLLAKLWLNPINIPLRHFAFATRPSKEEFLVPGLSPAYVEPHRFALFSDGTTK